MRFPIKNYIKTKFQTIADAFIKMLSENLRNSALYTISIMFMLCYSKFMFVFYLVIR